MRTITKDNYLQFKPSQLIRSFIEHINSTGDKLMNMDYFTPEGAARAMEGCLPCLGGTACMNMGLQVFNSAQSLGQKIAGLGNALRMGNGPLVDNWITQIYPIGTACLDMQLYMPENTRRFSGAVDQAGKQRLIAQVEAYALAYESKNQ